MKKFLLALAIAALGLCLAGCAHQPAWPRVPSAIARSDAVEAQVALMVSQMTLAQKVGQMTQPEIGHVTPAQVTQFYIGSVHNGGGSWPNGNRAAGAVLARWEPALFGKPRPDLRSALLESQGLTETAPLQDPRRARRLVGWLACAPSFQTQVVLPAQALKTGEASV